MILLKLLKSVDPAMGKSTYSEIIFQMHYGKKKKKLLIIIKKV